MRVLTAIALVLATAGTFDAFEKRQTSSTARQDSQIEATIAAFMKERHLPSASVAVVVGNKVRFLGTYGTADLENSVPAKPATVYRIASVSKALTAVSVMQLVDSGQLDLDAPVQKYAPAFPQKAFPITTRQVLAHLAGIRNYRPGEGERTDNFDRLTDALEVFKDDALEWEPGTRYGYTTFGYTLLGVILEGASGMSYPRYMQEKIFQPAGMTKTRLDEVAAIIPNRARGYTPTTFAQFDGVYRNARLMDSSYKAPGGGLVSTAEDLARFAIAVQSGVLIKPATLKAMSENQATRNGTPTGYGYGLYIENRPNRQPDGSIWHGGVQPGFTSDLWMIPAKGFAVVILTNLEGGGILGLATLAGQIASILSE